MLHTLQSMLVVAGLFGLIAVPFVGIMLILLAMGASSGLIIGLGFVAMLASGTFAVSQRGQTFLTNGLRKATRH